MYVKSRVQIYKLRAMSGRPCTAIMNTYTKDTEESEDGKIIVVSAKFRQYANIEDCYADRGVFLTSSQHYASLFELQTNDYVGWARGLKAAKYATDPQYDQKLISVITSRIYFS